MNGRCWRFSVLQLRVLEGVEVIEQASPEGDHSVDGLTEVGVREVKSHLEERLTRQLDWSEPLSNVVGSTLSKLLVKVPNSNWWENA